jgi:hypothetical protein
MQTLCGSCCQGYAPRGGVLQIKRNGSAHSWAGMQSAADGDRIGLMLDTAQGILTVYKHTRRLGTLPRIDFDSDEQGTPRRDGSHRSHSSSWRPSTLCWMAQVRAA